MTRHGILWRIIACSVAIVLGVTACTSSSADDPTTPSGTTPSASVVDPSVVDSSAGTAVTSSAAGPTPSVIDVPTPTSAPPTSLDPEAQEAADRAAIEAQWVKFWDVYINIVRTPAAERDSLAATVATEPTRSNLQKYAAGFEAQGKDNYGRVVHRLSWLDPVGSDSEAVLADCQDQSQFGSIDVATGKKRTVGVARDNIKGVFERGTDGIWRVKDIYYLTDVPC